MALIRENVRQEDWEFFNALNIKFLGKHITANKYSTWVIDREREMIFTTICWGGRDYGSTYILIWGKVRVYIYVESRSVRLFDKGVDELHWDIQRVTSPISLRDKRDELVKLIRELAVIHIESRNDGIFVIDNITDPQFVEGE